MKSGISGYVPVRDVIKLDYCAALSVESLLPICSEVVVSDGESTDGTFEFFTEWSKREPKIRVITYPWPDPVGDLNMLKKWLNWTRNHLEYRSQITMDADEVLSPKSYSLISKLAEENKCAWMKRHNFWGSPYFIAPLGTVCGEEVVRLGPTEYEMVSDGFEIPEPPIRQEAGHYLDELEIFHYGFIRKREAFFAKSRVVQRAILNTHDARLAKAEAEGIDWVPLCPFEKPLIPFEGKHPMIMKGWLEERGFSPRV